MLNMSAGSLLVFMPRRVLVEDLAAAVRDRGAEMTTCYWQKDVVHDVLVNSRMLWYAVSCHDGLTNARSFQSKS